MNSYFTKEYIKETIYPLLESYQKREEQAKSLFKEIMAKNIPNMGRNLDIQVHNYSKVSERDLF